MNLSLNDVCVGQCATILALKSSGNMRRRLLDIGLVKDTIVKCVGKNASGNMKSFLIRGAFIAIRTDDLKNILIK